MFQDLLQAADPIQTPIVGEIISGTVISATPRMILVDLGGQFTGVIAGAHMTSSTEDASLLSTGDRVDSIVI